MSIYSSSVVLLYRDFRVTVELVTCGEDSEARAARYVAEHQVSDGTYEIVEVEAEVTERPPTWGLVGGR